MCRVQEYLCPSECHNIVCSFCKPGEALPLLVCRFTDVQYHGRGYCRPWIRIFRSKRQKRVLNRPHQSVKASASFPFTSIISPSDTWNEKILSVASATDCTGRLSATRMYAMRSIALRSIAEPGSTSDTPDSTNLWQQPHHLCCMRYSMAKWTGSVMPSTAPHTATVCPTSLFRSPDMSLPAAPQSSQGQRSP